MPLRTSLVLGSLGKYDVVDIDLLTLIVKMTEPNHPLGVHKSSCKDVVAPRRSVDTPFLPTSIAACFLPFFAPRFPPLPQKEIVPQRTRGLQEGQQALMGHLACISIKKVSVSAQKDLKHQVGPPRAAVAMEMVSRGRNSDWFKQVCEVKRGLCLRALSPSTGTTC